MIKTYLPYDPTSSCCCQSALQEWLPDDHLGYFTYPMWWTSWTCRLGPRSSDRYEREHGSAGRPYHPRMMVKVLLYGYCVGVASSRRIAQRLQSRGHRLQGVGCEQHTGLPDHLADFR